MLKLKTTILGEKVAYATFNIMDKAGGELRGKEVIDKLNDEQKNLLPLHAIYFLGSNE